VTKKIAVILHGYPAPENQSTPIWKCLEQLGYEVILPRYLESEDRFSIEWFEKEIDEELMGRKPDVMVGVSMGGFILPYVAKKFPQAKLIFVATGLRMKAKLRPFQWVIKWAAGQKNDDVVKLIIGLPEAVMGRGYSLVHHSKDPSKQEFLAMDKKSIIDALKRSVPQRHREVARFMINTNTAEIVKGLQNQALVISGVLDEIMPLELGKELSDTMTNCKLVAVNAQHYETLNDEALSEVRKFLA
jgi:esterase/lipase